MTLRQLVLQRNLPKKLSLEKIIENLRSSSKSAILVFVDGCSLFCEDYDFLYISDSV